MTFNYDKQNGKFLNYSSRVTRVDLNHILCARLGDTSLKLDVFEPAGLKPTDHRPAIVFFFGGGWSGGDAKQFYQQAKAMTEQGMVVFSADYRVKSRNKTTPFECVKDGKSAIRWVREHAAELGIDPDRIVAAGGSAGGHDRSFLST